jgi:hypothetical protein
MYCAQPPAIILNHFLSAANIAHVRDRPEKRPLFRACCALNSNSASTPPFFSWVILVKGQECGGGRENIIVQRDDEGLENWRQQNFVNPEKEFLDSILAEVSGH